MYLAEGSFIEEMVSTAKVEQNKDKYLFVYLENPNRDIIKQANKYARENNLIIYYCSNFECDFDVETKYCYTDGPAEFFYRIKNSEHVITDAKYCEILFNILCNNFDDNNTDMNDLTIALRKYCFDI